MVENVEMNQWYKQKTKQIKNKTINSKEKESRG